MAKYLFEVGIIVILAFMVIYAFRPEKKAEKPKEKNLDDVVDIINENIEKKEKIQENLNIINQKTKPNEHP